MKPEIIEKLVVVDISPVSTPYFTLSTSPATYVQALLDLKWDANKSLSEVRKLADQELTKVSEVNYQLKVDNQVNRDLTTHFFLNRVLPSVSSYLQISLKIPLVKFVGAVTSIQFQNVCLTFSIGSLFLASTKDQLFLSVGLLHLIFRKLNVPITLTLKHFIFDF